MEGNVRGRNGGGGVMVGNGWMDGWMDEWVFGSLGGCRIEQGMG